MLNHITLMGRLTRDPELRTTGTGVSVASFSLAVDRPKRKDTDTETDFIDCVAWRNTADFVSKYFAKGQMAVVEGRLQIRNWQDKDGGKRRSAEIVASEIYFGEPKKSNDGQSNQGGYGNYGQGDYNQGAQSYGGQQSNPYDQKTLAPGSGDFQEIDDDDELPF